MAKRYAFLVNSDRCIGCYGCAMACKDFNQLDVTMIWRYVYPLAESIYPYRERAFYSLACNHCENPACLSACPTASYVKRADGIVQHIEATCIGCGNCIRACPYGAPRYNSNEKHVQKCSMCYTRIDAGLLPSCVQGCPTGALQLVNLNDFNNPNVVQYPEGYPDIQSINPSTRFILPRMPRLVRS